MDGEQRLGAGPVHDEHGLRQREAGLWAGAFIAPWDWRGRNKRTAILSVVSVPGNAQDILLNPEQPTVECRIKGTFAPAGKCSYHLPGGRGYEKIKMDLTRDHRWFCSVEEATAEGCRAARR